MTQAAVPSGYRLIERDLGDVLFARPGEVFTARRLLHDAAAFAASLPDVRFLVNLCQDRYHFAVAFAAAMLRGQVTLLSSNRSLETLRRLGDDYPDLVSVADHDDCVSPFHHLRIGIAGSSSAARVDNPLIPAERPAAIVFTSGSTGAPVGHRKSFGALVERSRSAARAFGMRSDASPAIVGTVPPQHMYGFETTVLQPLHSPSSSWACTPHFPADIAEALAVLSAPRLLVTTPLQLRVLTEAATEIPPLHAIISATSPMDPGLAGAAERRFGVPVLEIFGATEVGSIAHRRTTSGDLWSMYPGVRLSPRADGAIVSAPWAEPQPLGDVVELEGPDAFRLVGRPGDLIKIGGRRASLAGLTRILNGIDGVRDGIYVKPHDLDRRPTARLEVYVVAPDRAADDIKADLRARVDPVFVPRRVVRVAALPRNEVGKLPSDAVHRMQLEHAEAGEGSE